MASKPGGRCPRCRTSIKFERKGKQNCQKCGMRIDVDIKDVPVDREMYGNDTDMRTRIMEA